MYNAAPLRVVTVIILPLLCGESATLPQIMVEMKLLSDKPDNSRLVSSILMLMLLRNNGMAG
jgi:hypothetical protein